MKDLFSLLSHAYGKNAVKCSSIKKEVHAIQQFFDERKLPCKIKDDFDLLQMSAQRDALSQKELLDDQLFRSLNSMQDYMPTLHYDEINRLLLVDQKELVCELKQFSYQGKQICLPCFSVEINERYLCSPALFTYPSYQYQLRHYEPYLQWGNYGNLPYVSGFGICQCLKNEKEKQRCVLYLSSINRFYLLESGACIEVLSLPSDLELRDEELSEFSQAFINLDIEELYRLLKNCEGVKRRFMKKLEKLNYDK